MTRAEPSRAERRNARLLRARGLWEQLKSLELSPPVVDSEAPLAESVRPRLLVAWARAFAEGDIEALGRRLSWDGLELEQVERALAVRAAESRGTVGAAGVSDWSQRIEALGLERRDLRAAAGGETLSGSAFAELWRPWVAAALERLGRESADAALLSDLNRQRLGESLGREIARISERATYEQFVRYRKSSSRSGVYAEFVEQQLGRGLAPLYDEFPVLWRQSGILVDTFVDSIAELLRRLRADRPELNRLLGPVEVLEWIEPLPSDRHAGGRTVFRLSFTGGVAWVYKPRPVEAERAWDQILGWLRAAGLDDTPPSAPVLARSGYGWMASIDAAEPRSPSELARWFRRAGATLALADLVGASDLHAENVVAHDDGPVLVDLELLLQPARAARDLERGSPLATGLLADPGLGRADRVRRWAGLTAVEAGRLEEVQRGWADLNLDSMRPAAEAPQSLALANLPCGSGTARSARPEEFRAEIVAGYEDAYRFLLSQRQSLLAAKGPLSGMAGIPIRLLFRPSQEYAGVLDQLTQPRFQRDGADAGLLLEAALRPFSAATERPQLWPLVAEERVALETLDLPRFETRSDSTSLRSSSGEEIPELYLASGFDRARQRFALWSESDLERQVASLSRVLTPPRRATCGAGEPERERQTAGRFGDAADLLAAELADRRLALTSASTDPTGSDSAHLTRSSSLYDGLAGEALALAAAAARDGSSPRTREAAALARSAFEQSIEVAAGLRESPIGGFSGVGSWIWSLVALDSVERAARLGGSSEASSGGGALQLALRLAAGLDDARLCADRRLDVEGGLAGALLALLALHEASGEPLALERARRAGNLLLERAEPMAGGLAWRGELGRPLAGFAHGAGGIARALAALERATADERFGEAVSGALRFEATLFDPARRNWRVVLAKGTAGEPRATWMTAWCHGAAGIALARALLAPQRYGVTIDEELERAVATTLAADGEDVSGDDHLCCGAGGRSAILDAIAGYRRRADWHAGATALAERLLARAQARGEFSLPVASANRPEAEWGMMRGRAGLLYWMLDLAGGQLPGLLGLELPSERSARTLESR